MRTILLALLAAGCVSPGAPEATTAPPSGPVVAVADLLGQSPASDWRALDPENTIYMELASGRVIIELAPDYAPNHARNIRALVRGRYFDGAVILRSQENYVVQWGRPDEDTTPLGAAAESVEGEVSRARAGSGFVAMPERDTYAPQIGFASGFQAAANGAETWLTHCYASVGSARGDGLGSGNGAQLYVVTGQSPRHLDRNITLVGRVVQGMELLSVMPRGTGALGFYETAEERAPIRSIRVAADVPAGERANLEVLRTDSATFAAFVETRRWRREDWFVEPTGAINVCNVAVPVRPRS